LRSVLILSLSLTAGLAPAGMARAQQPIPETAPSADSAGAPAGDRDRVTFIQDARLQSDSTLFPYDWPALEALRVRMARLRPALEAGAVEELADALPAIRACADTLQADSIPTRLAPRSGEVRERMAALSEALRLAQELEPAALAAPRDTSPAREAQGFAPLEAAGAAESLGADSAAARERVADSMSADSARADSASRDSTSADSLAARDPVGAYLEAWREVYANEEALLHRVRAPFGP
jgi:hypothetical protein